MTSTIWTGGSQALATAYGNQRKVDRASNGVLLAVAAVAAGSNSPSAVSLKASTDSGTTWASASTDVSIGTGTGGYAGGFSFYVDADDYAHLIYNNTSTGVLYYVRGTPNTTRTTYAWSAATQVTGAMNAYADVVAFRDPAGSGGWVAQVVYNYNSGSGSSMTCYRPVSITSAGVVTVGGEIRLGSYSVSAGLFTYPSIDFQHTGDGKTPVANPALFVGWTAGNTGTGFGIRFKKGAYASGAWTWGTEREIDASHNVNGVTQWLNTFYDGTRVVFAGHMSWGGNTQTDIVLHERDLADTITTTRTLVANTNTATADALLYGSAAYDATGNVHLFGSSTTAAAGSRALNRRRWVRSGASLDPVSTFDTTGNGAPYIAARRGTTGSRLDWVYTDGATSPYTVTYGALVLNTAPNAPTLSSPASNAAIDVTVTNRFAWAFSDPDAGDSQSQFDLQYRTNAGGTTGTWATVTSATPNSFYDFTAGSFTSGTSYEWQVRTYDALGAVGPWSSSGFFTAATPQAPPTITAPINGATIGAASTLVTWSEPNQAAYQVQRCADNAGATDTATVYWDSGAVTDTSARQLTVPFETNGRVEHLRVRAQYQGLWSNWSDVRVTVSYTPPAGHQIVLTPNNAAGLLTVGITNVAATGGQPAVAYNDVWVNDGPGTGFTRRATNVAPNAPWTHWTARSGWDYAGNVRVVAVATNGTTTTTTA